VQNGCENLPSDVELVVADKVGVITLESVEDECLISLRDVGIGIPPLVRPIHIGLLRAHGPARRLCVHLQIDRLGGLDAEYKLVARGVEVIAETPSDVFELDPHLYLGFVQGFPGLEDEGDAFPTGIVDPERRRSECGARGVRRHGIVIEVARVPVRSHILAEERVLFCDRRDGAENFDLMRMTTAV